MYSLYNSLQRIGRKLGLRQGFVLILKVAVMMMMMMTTMMMSSVPVVIYLWVKFP